MIDKSEISGRSFVQGFLPTSQSIVRGSEHNNAGCSSSSSIYKYTH